MGLKLLILSQQVPFSTIYLMDWLADFNQICTFGHGEELIRVV